MRSMRGWLALVAGIPLLASAQGFDCNAPGASNLAFKGMSVMFKGQKERVLQRNAKLDELVEQKMQLSHWSKEHKAQFFAQLIKTQRFAELQKDIEALGPAVNAALKDVEGYGKAGTFEHPAACRRILDVLSLFNQVEAAAERQAEYMASQIKAAD
jgi:hypothetical protein